MPGPLVSLRNISKRFGATEVLRDISFDIEASEFLTLLGESGSGKTTLLRMVAGFEQPTSGELWMDGQRLDIIPPERRSVNTVFQHYALFPHLSVFENVAYGLRAKKTARSEIEIRVQDALRQIRMESFAKRLPSQLSGGQQQRVALARALVNRPKILLLDEPLSALDASLRRQMQVELKALQREVGITFLFVTHDQEEALSLSDRIALLRHGRIEQLDTPREIYNRPQTEYAATFIGRTNLLHAKVKNGEAVWGPMRWPVASLESEILFSLRPERVHIGRESSVPDVITVTGTIGNRVFAGASELLTVHCGEGLELQVAAPPRRLDQNEVVLQISSHDLIPLSRSS